MTFTTYRGAWTAGRSDHTDRVFLGWEPTEWEPHEPAAPPSPQAAKHGGWGNGTIAPITQLPGQDWYEARKARGQCVKCQRQAVPGRTLCQQHATTQRTYEAMRRVRDRVAR